MNKTTIGIGAVAIAVVSLLLFSDGTHPELLSGSEFVKTYQSTQGAVLLDVRTPGEFTAGHIEGATNIDFENPSFASELLKLDKEKSYFVYCRSGNRSGQAITLMKSEGFKNIYELQGGVVSQPSSFQLVTTTDTPPLGQADSLGESSINEKMEPVVK